MGQLARRIRRATTTALIRLGADNKLVLALVDRGCRTFGASLTNHGPYLSLRKGQKEMWLAKKHLAYAPALAQKFDLYFNDLKPTKFGGKLVLDYSRSGTLQTYLHSGLQFHMASFPEEIEAFNEYLRWYTPKAGDIVFDIGAHCGVTCYHFAKLVGPSGRVIAFEPDPMNFPILLRNIDLHSLTNVIPLQIAIAGSAGEAAFNCDEAIGSGLTRQATRTSVGKVVMVNTITLEHAFREWGPPQFCKIDIEGAEIEVISAAREYLRSSNCECHFALDTGHLVDGSFTDARIEAFFHEAGYEAETCRTDSRTTWAHKRAG